MDRTACIAQRGMVDIHFPTSTDLVIEGTGYVRSYWSFFAVTLCILRRHTDSILTIVSFVASEQAEYCRLQTGLDWMI